MTHHRWDSRRVVAATDTVIAIERRPPQPGDPGPVSASAMRFVLEDQARGTSGKAANADVVPYRERRSPAAAQDKLTLRTGLSAQQLDALATLEQFHWSLRFVRRPIFLAPIPIVFSPDDTRFIVIEADGTINENPGFTLRP